MGFARSPNFCHLCGRPLIGSYVQYNNDLIVCSSCKQTKPKCAHCRMPALHLDGDHLCPSCAKKALHCYGCGRLISGQFYRFGDSPQPYCLACSKEQPHCDVCGVPIGAAGQQLSGGQRRCGDCSKTLVLKDDEVQALFQAVIQHTPASCKAR
jgi:hypothetical protein